MSDWYQRDAASTALELKVDPERGLSVEDVRLRQKQYGLNELIATGGRGPWAILRDQLSGAMVLMLIAAAIVSAYLGEHEDAVAILAIVVLNAALGFFQEYRAEKAMAALKQLAVPHVRALREGSVSEFLARELVPGDVVLLEAGNLVPADGRLIEVHNLKVQEATLTGESEAIEKHADPLPDAGLPVADRRNMVHMGTIVTYGRGRLLVTATGMRTELGHIARMLQTVEAEPTPLQRRLAHLGRALAVAALAIVAVVFGLGLLQGRDWQLMLRTAMSMAVAAVPEGLPAVATVALAVGARRMLRRNALIRKLHAVETLGSVTVICSDKTGTLTQNRMTVTVLDLAGHTVDLTAHLRRENAVLEAGEGRREGTPADPNLLLMLTAGALCNDATLERAPQEQGGLRAVGDPTEGALVIAAARFDLRKEELESEWPRTGEIPFDSQRKRMTTVHRLSAGRIESTAFPWIGIRKIAGLGQDARIAFTKGAVDGLLAVADRVWTGDGIHPLDESWRRRIEAANDELAGRGMRVLGIAFRPLSSAETMAAEEHLIFLGMFGMIDPPRAEVREAVERCRTAGIRPVMITGDHPLTAQHIARELRISEDGEALTGRRLEELEDAEFDEAVERVSVYARVSPEHKLRIVDALQRRGHSVAMTGDGVNDAPALKKADIGVAMGITGTDVSKEASNMVLLDDNFATIVNAVEQGRIVYDNIRKFVKYALTGNAGEIWVMLLPSLLALAFPDRLADLPLPLLPLQILWINLVTDGLPGLALALEPAERDTMRRPPHAPSARLIDRGMAHEIVWFGLLIGVVSFAAGGLYWHYRGVSGDHAAYGNTIVFTVITLAQMCHVLAIRSSRDSLFSIGLLSNPWLLGAVLLTFGLQICVTYVPWLSRVFGTVPLSLADLGICIALSTVIFWAVEAHKWHARRKGP